METREPLPCLRKFSGVASESDECVTLGPTLLDVWELEGNDVLTVAPGQLDEGIDGRQETCTGVAIKQVVACGERCERPTDKVGLPQPIAASARLLEKALILARELGVDVSRPARQHAIEPSDGETGRGIDLLKLEKLRVRVVQEELHGCWLRSPNPFLLR